jgi:hypothetical protein
LRVHVLVGHVGLSMPQPRDVARVGGALTSCLEIISHCLSPISRTLTRSKGIWAALPPNASQAELAERYRLAQAAKVIRQLEQVALGGKTKNRKS